MGKNREVDLLPKKRDAFSAIRKFMCDGGVTLRTEEEQILSRWIFCDALLKAKEDTEESIIKKIVDNYQVSVFTARNDIQYTQRLFADARKVNKRYLIHHHLERIDQDIQRIRKKLFDKYKDEEGKEHEPMLDAKELASYAKLLETYTYTLNSVPEEVQVDKQPPPVFQFMLAPGQVIERPMLVEDALKRADEILLTKNKDGVYAPDTEE